MPRSRYRMLDKLNQGSFGKIHKALDTETGRHVAIKVETGKSNGHLTQEMEIYQRFVNCKISSEVNWPVVHAFARLPSGTNIMIMDLLGPDIDRVKRAYKTQRIPSYTVGYLAYKMIHLIKLFHDSGFVHRDIKPQNFVLQYFKDDACPKFPEVFLVDYGLAKRYRNADQTHAQFANNCGLMGTVRYVSPNIHLGIESSRRDDLYSLGYSLLYCALGSLPWQAQVKKKEPGQKSKADMQRDVMVHKMRTNPETLCEGLIDPLRSALLHYLFYVNSLMYHEEPDYEYCQQLFAVMHNNFVGFG